jgi:hypothetical protein
MAILRRVGPGVTGKTEPVADISYVGNDALAQLIVDAWVDKKFEKLLLNKDNAKSLLAARGFYLNKVAVIDEATYWGSKHVKSSDDEVVFVLPNRERADLAPPPGHSLLDTARFLMACVPNGI